MKKKLGFQFPECSYILCKEIANERKENRVFSFPSAAISYAKVSNYD